jgi:hypothetical protein
VVADYDDPSDMHERENVGLHVSDVRGGDRPSGGLGRLAPGSNWRPMHPGASRPIPGLSELSAETATRQGSSRRMRPTLPHRMELRPIRAQG